MTKTSVAVKPVKQREWRLMSKRDGRYINVGFENRDHARVHKTKVMIDPSRWLIIPVIISPAPRKAKKK